VFGSRVCAALKCSATSSFPLLIASCHFLPNHELRRPSSLLPRCMHEPMSICTPCDPIGSTNIPTFYVMSYGLNGPVPIVETQCFNVLPNFPDHSQLSFQSVPRGNVSPITSLSHLRAIQRFMLPQLNIGPTLCWGRVYLEPIS
jgi:hypothetical protein